MSQTFITYKEQLNEFDQNIQDQILNASIASWKAFGFSTKVLSRENAENHKLYKDLLFASKKHCKPINPINTRRMAHSEASIIRWLAFANSKAKKFFLGDYDIMNLGVACNELNYKNLTFLDGQCLCFSFAESWEWCEMLAEIFIKNIDIMTEWNKPHVFYHDQDLVETFCNKHKKEIFDNSGISFERKYVTNPPNGEIPNDCKFLHVSHFSHKKIGSGGEECELRRLETANKALKKLKLCQEKYSQ